jgi:PAS domain S-box-containing protein
MHADQQLKASLKEIDDLKAALDEHAIVAITDFRGKITYVNDKFCAISKYSRAELLGQDHRLINSGHHSKEFIGELWNTITHGKVWKGEIKNKAKDGSFYWVATTIVPFLNEAGKPRQYVAIRADITEKKIAEERAVWLGSFPELNPNPIIEFDPEQEIIHYANPRAAQVFPDLANLKLHHPILANLQERIKALAIAATSPFRREVDVGKECYAQTVIFVPESQRVRVYCTNITERKRTEDQLYASLKEIGDLKSALDEHAIVAITNPQGLITYVNEKFCAISKYSREELLGQDHRLINSGYHSKGFIRELWTTIAQGKVWKGEIKNKAKDGSYYWVDTTIVPFLDEAGKPRQYVAIRADITERKAAEEKIRLLNADLEIRVSERTAELESFSYSVSHDLRAPLRAMGGYARMIQEDFGAELPPEARQKLARIHENANKMGQLIDGLLTFSRLSRQPLKKQKTAPAGLIPRVLEELQPEQAGRRITINTGDLPICLADPTLLHQVFANLISNALKYTRQRNPAEIEIGWDEAQQAYFVKDNGAGFDMQYAEKLFGVFQRLHRADEFEGTGVGLAIVQRIIHRHGGRIWAHAEPEKGAVFYFTLTEAHQHA